MEVVLEKDPFQKGIDPKRSVMLGNLNFVDDFLAMKNL